MTWRGTARRQHAGPTVEQHHASRPRPRSAPPDSRSSLGHQQVHQPARTAPARAYAMHADRGEILRAAAFDHVAGDGERAAGKADQRRIRRQPGPHAAAPSPGSARWRAGTRRRVERGNARPHRGSAAAPGLRPREAQAVAERPGQHQDVAEQDGGVHAVAPHGCSVTSAARSGVGAEAMKSPALAADGAVFRQIAAGLAHQPDRRRPDGFAAQHPQKRLSVITSARPWAALQEES